MVQFEQLKALKLAHPFKPFYLTLKNGRKFLVERSAYIGMAPDGSRLGVTGDDGVVLFKMPDVLNVEILESAPK